MLMEQEVNSYGGVPSPSPFPGRLGTSWNSVNLWESWGACQFPMFFHRFFLFFFFLWVDDEVILKP